MSSRPVRVLRTALLIGLFAIPVHLAPAQDRVREVRSVASFTEIEYGIPGTLHLRQGDDSSVEIEAPQKVLDKVKTTVDGETLKISDGEDSGLLDQFFGGDGLDTDQIDVYVTASTLRHLTLAGSGRVVGESRVTSESLSLTVAGSGDMDLDLNAEELSVRVAGSGTCTLQGEVSSLNVDLAGSGDLRAAALSMQRAEVRIAGSGSTELTVADRLSAKIFGSGDVRYRGRPTVETSTFGSGEVKPLE